jgi:thiol:disulfide interchange protein DsbD
MCGGQSMNLMRLVGLGALSFLVIAVDLFATRAETPPEGLLSPAEAFRARATGTPDGVRVQWVIADGYYLYRSKFRVRADTPGVELGEPVLPQGEIKTDEFFGDVEIFRNRVAFDLPYTVSDPNVSSILLHLTSQGCADIGICYPPHTETRQLDLPVRRHAELQAVFQDAATAKGNPLTALTRLAADVGPATTGEDFLDPDAAFSLTTDVRDKNTIVARWEIAEGYYLYRDKFKFGLEEAQGVALGGADLAPGKVKNDELFGSVAVFYDEAVATIQLRRMQQTAVPLDLNIGYQGCAEAGLCYPPITKHVSLVLPAVTETTGRSEDSEAASTQESIGIATAGNTEAALSSQSKPGVVGKISEQDRIAHSLASGKTGAVLAAFFGFGLLLAFTPCIFPMIPILSSIIVGQGERITTRRAVLLSAVYVFAMALTYTLAGVLAGLSGHNLQAVFQDPWIIASFSAVFVLLALSMFGFYELQLPANWQARLVGLSNRQQGGTLIGAGIMGLLSALIVGPCVAPPLAGALIYIGQTGDGLLGGMALFALSLGIGAPLLVIGTSAGRLLPRAGPWMSTIKSIFGVVLLGVAIYLLERIVPAWIALLLWSALLIVTAIYMGALDPLQVGASGWRRLWKGAGLVLLFYGALLMVGATGGAQDVLQPLKGVSLVAGGAEHTGIEFKRVKGVEALRAELARAKAEDKPVMLDYYADWCVSCKEMEKYTFSDPSVQDALLDVVLLQADVTANDEHDQALLKQFGLYGPPAILFFGPDGQERRGYRVVGFMNAEQFRVHALEVLS